MKFNFLFLTEKDPQASYEIPKGMTVTTDLYDPLFTKKTLPDLTLIDRELSSEEISHLESLCTAYTVVYTSASFETQEMRPFLKMKLGIRISEANIQGLIDNAVLSFGRKSVFGKHPVNSMHVSETFAGSISFEGNSFLQLSGEFGDDFTEVMNWRYNLPLEVETPLELWPEYTVYGEMEIILVVRRMIQGTADGYTEKIIYTQKDLERPVVISASGNPEYLALSIAARGNGTLRIGSIHYRNVAKGIGLFMAGGRRFADADREEFFYYFNPMDLKPPLNVYFSGYRTVEGFEVYPLMKSLGAPFMLFSDPRLEGGAFYLGSEEYEEEIASLIMDAAAYLGFTKDEIILSGISMGTYGATYYSTKVLPHAVIIAKPLMSAGNIANNLRSIRPNDFETSLDLLLKNEQDQTPEAIERMNRVMWDALDAADFSHTEFAISYMIHDDYDRTAYADLLDSLGKRNISIYGKGVIGRHNDNTDAVVHWFESAYKKILRDDFGRER